METNNLLTKEELKILELFEKNLFGNYTIREIMKKIQKNSYNWIFKAVNKLNKLEILDIETKGKSNICSINLNNLLTLSYFNIIEKSKISGKLPLKNIYELIKVIPLFYFSFIISGSYATRNATKESDLDVVIIIENKEDVKKVYTILKNKGELMTPPIHLYVFSDEEFLKMLLSKEENYGKMIFRNHIIIFGVENYFWIVKKAIENGFKG